MRFIAVFRQMHDQKSFWAIRRLARHFIALSAVTLLAGGLMLCAQSYLPSAENNVCYATGLPDAREQSSIESIAATLFGVVDAKALEPGRRYDRSGRYQGRVTEDGRIYDRSGRYQGRVTEDGRSYDRSGRYQGRATEDGRYYDRSGRYQGRQTEDGRFYDRSGRYQGRVTEDGRYYDGSGRYQGRRVAP